MARQEAKAGKSIDALTTYNLLYDDGNRMEVISEVLAHREVLDALYEYMTFRPSYKGYYRKQVPENAGTMSII